MLNCIKYVTDCTPLMLCMFQRPCKFCMLYMIEFDVKSQSQNVELCYIVMVYIQDGCVCWFDMRCKEVLFTMNDVSQNPVSSLCFNSGQILILCLHTRFHAFHCYSLYVE